MVKQLQDIFLTLFFFLCLLTIQKINAMGGVSKKYFYERYYEMFRYDKRHCQGVEPPVPNFWKGKGERDVTFIAFGDSQMAWGTIDKNIYQVKAINSIENHSWPIPSPFAGTPITNVRGVMIAGDITNFGSDGREKIGRNELSEFVKLYGLCGNRRLRYPVYEGYGNHDFYFIPNPLYLFSPINPVATSVAIRNDFRPGLTKKAEGIDGHYSWDWDDVHFVNLNLVAMDGDLSRLRLNMSPRDSLSFLKEDLKENIGDSKRPVIIMMHYGLIGWHLKWWSEEEVEQFYQVIKGYNILAIIHGHSHDTNYYKWKGINVYNVGSPFYFKWNEDFRGHFTLFRITNDWLEAYDVSWRPGRPVSDLKVNSLWYDQVKLKNGIPSGLEKGSGVISNEEAEKPGADMPDEVIKQYEEFEKNRELLENR